MSPHGAELPAVRARGATGAGATAATGGVPGAGEGRWTGSSQRGFCGLAFSGFNCHEQCKGFEPSPFLLVSFVFSLLCLTPAGCHGCPEAALPLTNLCQLYFFLKTWEKAACNPSLILTRLVTWCCWGTGMPSGSPDVSSA